MIDPCNARTGTSFKTNNHMTPSRAVYGEALARLTYTMLLLEPECYALPHFAFLACMISCCTSSGCCSFMVAKAHSVSDILLLLKSAVFEHAFQHICCHHQFRCSFRCHHRTDPPYFLPAIVHVLSTCPAVAARSPRRCLCQGAGSTAAAR